ncbi:MAG: hypothetical protein FOGNACKC_02216 [Anaerolineae bacterium]|nr:hypothetical protein [Anaerolineae bacterium]
METLQTAQDAHQYLDYLSYLPYLVTALVISFLGYKLAFKWLPELFKKAARQWPGSKQPPENPLTENQAEITDSIARLSKILAMLEKDTSQAAQLLVDAEVHTETLVRLITGTALKAEKMATDSAEIQALLDAIETKDPIRIYRAAAAVNDPHIRTLALAKVHDDGYWQNVGMLCAAQVGTLALWQRTYREFTTNLLADVSNAKASFAANTAALEMGKASRPLATAMAQLGQAQNLLQIQRRPEGERIVRGLPAASAGLLK